MAPRPPGLVCGVILASTFFVSCLGTSRTALAGTLDGRFSLEMEYVGESYFSEQQLTAADLDLGNLDSAFFSDTTRFASDTWLPGQKLELTWRTARTSRNRVQLYSRTAINRERVSQDLEILGELPGRNRGRWLFLLRGSFRDDKRSLVGNGDWVTRMEATREQSLFGQVSGGFRVGWDHSRTRGDSVSYLYDFDLLSAKVFASGGGSWLPGWETRLEAVAKSVPDGEPGGYAELHLGGALRRGGGRYTFLVDARARDYEQDASVGRDYTSGELTSWIHLAGGYPTSLTLELEGSIYNYSGGDELYFDSGQMAVRVPLKMTAGSWSLSVGPTGVLLTDLDGENRDYRQWTIRGGVNRLIGFGGFADLTLEGGYRDYHGESADLIEVSSLSTSILRSDYWVVDLLALMNLPFWAHFSLDLMASSSWELHATESERIHVTFANLGISRTF